MKNRSAKLQQPTLSRFTPSEFGSHSSMVNTELTERLEPDADLIRTLSNGVGSTSEAIVLTDEYGDYLTLKSKLDTRASDPNRYYGFTNLGDSTSITRANFSARQDRVNSYINNLN
jgi:hypothetical protein